MKSKRRTAISTTESSSLYSDLEKMSMKKLLLGINREDKKVPMVVGRAIPSIERLGQVIAKKMAAGGRLFYVGAGTSGRLGVVDASEIPPTFGLPHGQVIGLIAGGDRAIRKAVEHAEDDPRQGWKDLRLHALSSADAVIGIAASGRTPYVVGALKEARKHGVFTGCITCNKNTELARHADVAVELIVGPEFVTGSTRMKAGTAQKLALNMISTSVMVQLGRVKGNKMVDMMLTNKKLVLRGTRMIMEELGVSKKVAEKLLLKYGSVRNAVNAAKR